MSKECNSITARSVQALIKGCLNRGVDYRLILQALDIDEALLITPQARVTPIQFAQLIKAVITASNDEFLNMASHPSKSGVFSLMANHVIDSPDLRTALDQSCHFYSLVSKAINLRLTEKDNTARFSLELATTESDADFLLREYLLFVWLRFTNWLIGKPIPIDCIGLDYPQQAGPGESYLPFPGPVKFNQATNHLEFPAAFLDQPIVQTPETLRPFIKRAPLIWFDKESFHLTYSRKVVDLLRANSNFNKTQMNLIASQLHMTSRTLRRKLAEEGTSFQTIKHQIRYEAAIQLLNQNTQPLVHISTQLGFSEPSSFTRAFINWTGVAPGIYRNQAC
ncbi:AraC family transcriptional regulator [Amphritea sp. HPY]|uniref:AraC family transcriptional regulator n=1 Tax=Amphritea sp. HPY TaxID=3421652 RepID=UPI003D7DBF93